MQLYHKEEAIKRINQLAGAGKPFIFIIDYRQEHAYVEETDRVDASFCRYDFNGITNARPSSGKYSGEIRWNVFPLSLSEYRQAFDKVKNNILAGNSYLANLTCKVPVDTNLTLEDIFYNSKALYKLWLKDRFVCFSPEIFVRIEEGKIKSYPMKGTIDASLPHAVQMLMDNAKEAAEHATIVDLIRNDLSMVAEQVTVSRYRYCDRLQTNKGAIIQTSSEICGTLPLDYTSRLGELLFRLLPAGSITGAPKPKTMEIIAGAEGYERGFYTGVMGYSDGQKLDSAVMIRFMEQEANGQLFFKAGGGITCQSEAESEYNEMKQKIYVPIY
ncbi:aminodeoxychorismate synthase component I [Phocaeicola sp.]